MISGFIIVVTVLLSVVWYYSQKRRYWGNKKKLPGPIGLPYLGSVLQVALSPKTRNYEIFEDLCAKYGPVIGFRAGSEYIVLVNDFEVAKSIMASEDYTARLPPRQFIVDRSYNRNLGLLWSYGECHKVMRRYTTRSMRQFGFGKVANMETSIQEELIEFLKYFDKLREECNDTIRMYQMFHIPMLNLMWDMVAGFRFNYYDKKLRQLLEMSEEMQQAIRPGLTPLAGFSFLRHVPGLTEHDLILEVTKKVQNIFREMMAERRAKGSYLQNPQDFLEVFLKDIDIKRTTDLKSEFYDDEQMITVCVDLFFTSSDTTSSALEFGILYLITHPHALEKVTEEIERIVGLERLPNLDDRSLMPYVEATVLEILRYSSINPLAGRSPGKDTEINGHFIPKHAVIGILLHGVHFNEMMWGDPNNFRPERFLDEDMKIINADKIIPFGYGKRVCLGESLARASLFIFLTCLIQRYSFEKSPSYPEPTLLPRTGLTNIPQPYHVVVKLKSPIKGQKLSTVILGTEGKT